MKHRALALAGVFCLLIGSIQALQPASTTADTSPVAVQLFFPHVGGSPCDEFLETFDEPEPGWFIGQQNGLLAEVVGGEYRLSVSGGGTIWLIPAPVCEHVNYRAAVDAHWAGPTGNFYGLVFGLDDVTHRAYLFVVNTDSRVWLVFEVSDGALNTIIDAMGSDAILPAGGVNRLSAERNGATILLSINDTRVGEMPVALPGNPVVAGLVAASYVSQSAVDARFDNFQFLYRPPLP
jgi:hypothetical protein